MSRGGWKPGLVFSSRPTLMRKGVVMKFVIVFFGLLLAYTLIYTGISKLAAGLTVSENG